MEKAIRLDKDIYLLLLQKRAESIAEDGKNKTFSDVVKELLAK